MNVSEELVRRGHAGLALKAKAIEDALASTREDYRRLQEENMNLKSQLADMQQEAAVVAAEFDTLVHTVDSLKYSPLLKYTPPSEAAQQEALSAIARGEERPEKSTQLSSGSGVPPV